MVKLNTYAWQPLVQKIWKEVATNFVDHLLHTQATNKIVPDEAYPVD